MSAILAVCGTAFCAMVSDGRMVEEPITDGKIKVLTDALPKVRKLNPQRAGRLCRGCCGSSPDHQ